MIVDFGCGQRGDSLISLAWQTLIPTSVIPQHLHECPQAAISIQEETFHNLKCCTKTGNRWQRVLQIYVVHSLICTFWHSGLFAFLIKAIREFWFNTCMDAVLQRQLPAPLAAVCCQSATFIICSSWDPPWAAVQQRKSGCAAQQWWRSQRRNKPARSNMVFKTSWQPVVDYLRIKIPGGDLSAAASTKGQIKVFPGEGNTYSNGLAV